MKTNMIQVWFAAVALYAAILFTIVHLNNVITYALEVYHTKKGTITNVSGLIAGIGWAAFYILNNL